MNKIAVSDIKAEVQEYYGQKLETSDDLKTNACCSLTPPPKHVQEALDLVADEVKNKYYGCGLTIPSAIKGLKVLDLGSGSGRDCYILSKLIGENGQVVGVDMTEEQFNTLKTLHEQQLTALQELTTLTKEARGDQGDGCTDAGDAGKGGKDTPDNFSELKTSFESLASSITELKSQVTELADTAKPGTQVPTSTGAPDSAAQFV